MTLRELLRDLTTQPIPAIPITGVESHSKQIREGQLFVAVRGPNHDGNDFIDEAIKRGAAAVVAERAPIGYVPCPVIRVPDAQLALASIAARFYGRPVDQMRLIGVTGTCGKTTTAYITKAILEAAGKRAGLLGTVAYEIGARHVPSTNTTPGLLAMQQMLAQMVEHGLRWCVMEVSSHALDQRRVEGLAFDAAIWTNLGSDHLDYHKTLDRYAEAKRRIFTHLRPGGRAVLNRDDAYGQTLAERMAGPSLITFGVEREADVQVKIVQGDWDGMHLVITTPWGTFPAHTPLVGRHNASNIAAAAAACLGLGIPPTAIQAALAEFPQVPGRLERVPNESGVHVIIDFAHTADSLERVLLELRALVRGRIIAVFGCGGDRDQLKRPEMGKVASHIADHVILTTDNPRSEDPRDIILQIKSGFAPGFRNFATITDREEAIQSALSMARADDAVLIAGKGHEAYQIFQHTTTPFSDRQAVERYFAARTARTVTG